MRSRTQSFILIETTNKQAEVIYWLSEHALRCRIRAVDLVLMCLGRPPYSRPYVALARHLPSTRDTLQLPSIATEATPELAYSSAVFESVS